MTWAEDEQDPRSGEQIKHATVPEFLSSSELYITNAFFKSPGRFLWGIRLHNSLIPSASERTDNKDLSSH